MQTTSPASGNLSVTVHQPGIALVELSRGKVNAIDGQMYEDIAATFDALSDDQDVRVIVLTGQGRIFSAGNDINEFRTMFSVRECHLPVVSAVNGPALGSGFGLVALSDLVVASERATFGLPEMNVGVLGGGRFTARMLPQQAMRRMFLTAEPVDASTLERWGAPLEVVAHDDLLEIATARARSIAEKSRHAIVLAKQSLNGCEDLDIRRGYELEQSFTVRLSEHPDSKTAVEAQVADLARK